MGWIRILIASTLLGLNTLVHGLPLLLLALLKVALPWAGARRRLTAVLTGLAESWIGFNDWMIDRLSGMRIRIEGELPQGTPADLSGHYLVLANHQSWVDIPVLQRVFNRRLPLLRFFLKSQLIWVPLLGLAWWALDFPFMKRYSKETLAKKPQLAGRDVEATRRACRKFLERPVAVMNFVEGTRRTPAKHSAQQSPHEHLLRPRAGGIAFVLDAMQDAIETIIDVTLVYPRGTGELGALMAGRIPEVVVHVRAFPVPDELRGGDYQHDEEFRSRFQVWLNTLWEEKDARIEAILQRRRGTH